MHRIYFTSDLHLGHSNIIDYCSRPFSSVAEMDETIISRWNETVDSTDTVYLLGDFCFGGKEKTLEYLNRLQGQIILIQGNHDHRKNLLAFKDKNVPIHPYLDLPLGLSGRLVLRHRPLQDNGYTMPEGLRGCTFFLTGHVHNTWAHRITRGVKMINVGVDVWDFRPRTLYQLLADPTVVGNAAHCQSF